MHLAIADRSCDIMCQDFGGLEGFMLVTFQVECLALTSRSTRGPRWLPPASSNIITYNNWRQFSEAVILRLFKDF